MFNLIFSPSDRDLERFGFGQNWQCAEDRILSTICDCLDSKNAKGFLDPLFVVKVCLQLNEVSYVFHIPVLRDESSNELLRVIITKHSGQLAS